MAALTIDAICTPCCEGNAAPDPTAFMRNIQALLCSLVESGGVAENVNVVSFGGTAVTLGQKAMAASMPVVIASNQSSIPVTFSGTSDTNLTQVGGVAVGAGAGVSTAGTIRVVAASDSPEIPLLTAISGKLPATLGQKAMAASLAVVLASDQTSIPVAATLAAETTKVIGTVNQGTSPWVVSGTTAISGTVAVTQSTSPWVVSGTVAFSNSTIAVTNAGTFATQATLQAGSAIVGKVGIDQTTPGTTNGVQVNAALPAGTNLIGKVGIDQTTAGTTNAVSLAQLGATAIATGNGASSAGVIRVAQVNDGTGVLAGVTTVTTVTTLTGTTTLTPGTGAANLGKAEDAAHASGDTGVYVLAVIQGTLAASAADGDYGSLKTNTLGALYIEAETYPTAVLANVTSSASSTTLQASNTARRGLVMFNDADKPCYVKFGSTASATSFTYFLVPGGTLELQQPVYTGIVTGIWQAGPTGSMRVTEITA